MGQINASLVPTLAPGTIFEHFTTDTTINIRWLQPQDPVLFEAINRPMYDITLRQLIIAKAIDNLSLRLAFLSLFPFLMPPQVIIGSSSSGTIGIPLSWIWDMHVSVPAKWEYLRLANIKRISGTNSGGSSGDKITGKLRLTFSAQQKGTVIETFLFHVDYTIDSQYVYQFARIVPANTTTDGTGSIDPGEAETIAGFLIFRTLDTTDQTNKEFFLALQPPVAPTDSNGDGIFDNPTIYWLMDTPPESSGEFIAVALSHGTGVLVLSAYNQIPATDSDFNTWLVSNNYPFRIGATRQSTIGIVVPAALFKEFNIVAPAPDEPSNDVTKLHSPVWLSHIERVDTLATELNFVFATHTILDDGNPQVIEFASMILKKSFTNGQIVIIEPTTNLLKQTSSDQDNFIQGFGLGHVVLSSLWGGSTDEVESFFNSFLAITDVPAIASFTKESAILSSFAVSRVPKYAPTKGQSEALRGSTARLATPIYPSDSNRYITEADQGTGDAIDFRTLAGFPDDLRENPDIEPVAYTGALAHRTVNLIINSAGTNFTYDKDILPRLRCLYGRDPKFGDYWWDGTYLKFFTGDAWVSL